MKSAKNLYSAVQFEMTEKNIFAKRMEKKAILLFAHGCDVTSMSLVGSPMELTHSLTHSLLTHTQRNGN